MQPEKCVEFAVSLPHRPGSFAKLSDHLTRHGVRIRVFMLYTSYVMNVPDIPLVAGMCKMVVDDEDKAREALKRLEFKFKEERVLLLRTKKRGDLLPLILERIAGAGLNIIDAYGGLTMDGEGSALVLSVSDKERGLEIVGELDWTVS